MATPKAAAPVVGFNHNVKYGPRVYHVQTEDSGLPHAHYITHLFVGGNIVSSMKSSYAEKAGERDLARVVRGLMEHQHKAMLRRLVAGEFDELAERLSAPHYEPGVLADGTNTRLVRKPGRCRRPGKGEEGACDQAGGQAGAGGPRPRAESRPSCSPARRADLASPPSVRLPSARARSTASPSDPAAGTAPPA